MPDDLKSVYGIDPAGLDPRAAWRRVVERAIDAEVDAVLLAGDVVESNNGFMEAYGALQEGVARLATSHIDVVAVAGNHDVHVLPRLADEIDSFHLLGRRGRWESHLIQRDGVPLVRVIGWSFPETHVESSPLDSMPADMRAGRYADDAPDDLCTVGLLHCDLDASGSRYAPVTTAALGQLDSSLSAWFLGHIHAPSIGSAGRPSGYLGSLVSLKPTDLGARGPWLARTEPGNWAMEQLVLSPMRWESPEISIEACTDLDSLEAAILNGVSRLAATLGARIGETRVVGLRPRLVGRTAIDATDLARAIEQAGQLQTKVEGVLYFIDKVIDESQPAIDLEALGRGNDPAALIARRLLELQAAGKECSRLIEEARVRLDGVAGHRNFRYLDDAVPTDEEIRRLLMRMASRALGDLLAQKLDAPPSATEEVFA